MFNINPDDNNEFSTQLDLEFQAEDQLIANILQEEDRILGPILEEIMQEYVKLIETVL